MTREFKDPKILLLNENLGMSNTKAGDFIDISSVINQEKYWINIVVEKLGNEVNKPDIIIMRRSASYKILEELFKKKITVITDMKKHKMLRLQRLVQSNIVPSFKVLEKNFKLG